MSDFFNFFGELAETLWNLLTNLFTGLSTLWNFTLDSYGILATIIAYIPGVIGAGVGLCSALLIIKVVLGR